MVLRFETLREPLVHLHAVTRECKHPSDIRQLIVSLHRCKEPPATFKTYSFVVRQGHDRKHVGADQRHDQDLGEALPNSRIETVRWPDKVDDEGSVLSVYASKGTEGVL